MAPLLKPGAVAQLVYQPPAGQRLQRIAAACSDYSRKSGFAAVRVRTAEQLSAPTVGIAATWPRRGAAAGVPLHPSLSDNRKAHQPG